MADYVDHDEWEYDFTKMTCKYYYLIYSLEVRNSRLGTLLNLAPEGDAPYVWEEDGEAVQQAYSEWLDKQIYGESDGA